MGGSELQGRVAGRAEHNDAFAIELVEHGVHVVDDALNHSAFQWRDRIRRARSPRVEPDVAAKRGQPIDEPNKPRLVPQQIDG